MATASKKGARRQARLERRAQEEAQRRRSQQTRRLMIVAAAVLVAVGAGWAAWSASSRARAPLGTAATPPAPGAAAAKIISPSDQGRAHIRLGESHPAYNSNPPTSGWHYGTTAPWGFNTAQLPDEAIIHNLEHGGIWVSYKDDQDAEVVDALVALAREFPRKLIITHRPKNDTLIAVAAWGHLLKLDHYDRAVVVDFYNRFKNKGPEFVPD